MGQQCSCICNKSDDLNNTFRFHVNNNELENINNYDLSIANKSIEQKNHNLEQNKFKYNIESISNLMPNYELSKFSNALINDPIMNNIENNTQRNINNMKSLEEFVYPHCIRNNISCIIKIQSIVRSFLFRKYYIANKNNLIENDFKKINKAIMYYENKTKNIDRRNTYISKKYGFNLSILNNTLENSTLLSNSINNGSIKTNVFNNLESFNYNYPESMPEKLNINNKLKFDNILTQINISNNKDCNKRLFYNKGLIDSKSGSLYQGFINSSNQKQGKGKLYLKTGEIYEGNWVENNFKGWGRYKDKEGNIYQGKY